MKVILSGGGTGGHIYPAITIANTLIEKYSNTDVLFVGGKVGLESNIIPKEGFKFVSIDVRGLERRITLENFITLFKTSTSLYHARKILKEYKPDVVIGTGGYVCGPVLLMASLMGIPTIIQEQNVIPGITNKILAHFVDKIALGYEEAERHFKQKEKLIYTGNPIRKEILSVSKKVGISAFNLDPNKKTILVSGGSRGARSINNAMLDVITHFISSNEVQILHVTGQNEYNSIVDKIEQRGIDISKNGNISIVPYLYNMPEALAVADIVIFRAGATGLAEITAKGIPAILIPYPYAAENHQEHNARILEKIGAAKVIKDNELTGNTLINSLTSLIFDGNNLENMSVASKKFGKPDAVGYIANIIYKLGNKI